MACFIEIPEALRRRPSRFVEWHAPTHQIVDAHLQVPVDLFVHLRYRTALVAEPEEASIGTPTKRFHGISVPDSVRPPWIMTRPGS